MTKRAIWASVVGAVLVSGAGCKTEPAGPAFFYCRGDDVLIPHETPLGERPITTTKLGSCFDTAERCQRIDDGGGCLAVPSVWCTADGSCYFSKSMCERTQRACTLLVAGAKAARAQGAK